MGRFWVFFLSHTALGFNCGFISTSTCGSSTGVCSRGYPEGLGFAPVRARCGGGAAAWVAGVLAAPGAQGSWRLGQQEICSRRVCNQYWPICSNILVWRAPFPDRVAWQATVYRVSKRQTLPKWPCAYRCKTFFACGSSASLRVEAWRGSSCLRGHWRWKVCRDMDCLRRRSYATSESFFEPLAAGDQKAFGASLSP